MSIEKPVSEQKEEQVMLRFRGRSTNLDGVYPVIKFIEADQLYNSVLPKVRGLVTLSPFMMLRVAQRGEEGLADFNEMLGKMNLDHLVAFRTMFEMFRNNTDAIEGAINNSIVRRAVSDSSSGLMPGFNQDIQVKISREKVCVDKVVIDNAIKKSSADKHPEVEAPVAPTVLVGEATDEFTQIQVPRETVNVNKQPSQTSLAVVAPDVIEDAEKEEKELLDGDGDTVIPDLFG